MCALLILTILHVDSKRCDPGKVGMKSIRIQTIFLLLYRVYNVYTIDINNESKSWHNWNHNIWRFRESIIMEISNVFLQAY